MTSKVHDSVHLNAVYIEPISDYEELPGTSEKTRDQMMFSSFNVVPTHCHMTQTPDHMTQTPDHVTETTDHVTETTAVPQRPRKGRRCRRIARGTGVVGLVFTLMMIASFNSSYLVYKFEWKEVIDKMQPQQSNKEVHYNNTIIYQTTYTCTCPTGWLWCWGGRKCYRISKTKRTFSDANDYCHKKNSTIASPRSFQHNEFIRSLLLSSKYLTNFWLGLVRNATTGKWLWYNDQTEPTYTAWAYAEPHGIRMNNTEDCGAFYEYKAFLWGDYGCFSKFYTLCEKGCTHV